MKLQDYSRLIVKFIYLIFAMISNVYSENSGLILNTTVEWETAGSSFVQPTDPFTPLWNYKGTTYFVWVDVAGRPWVTSITGGTPTSVPLDNGDDYVVQPDGHHRFSMGIDKNGYIHITGDMHNYTDQTTGVINPYPTRYQKQTILYWKSNQPQSIADGFTFAGGLNAPTAIPGTGWIIGHFFTDNHGELYYTSQVHAIEAGNYPGEMGIGLYKYNTSANTWSALGGLADNAKSTGYYTVLFWDNSGFAPTDWFQGYFASFSFDSENRLHFATPANTSTAFSGSNRILYAMSTDGGVTWSKANGTAIPGVPLRGADGQANLADIVIDGGASANFGQVGVVADRLGNPAVFHDSTCVAWNGTNWSTTNGQTFASLPSANYGYVDSKNDLVMNFGSMPKILRTTDLKSLSYGNDYPSYNNLVCIDSYGLKRTGVISGIGLTAGSTTQSIVKTVITEAPLPDGWATMDISITPFPYGGTAGFYNGTFSTTNYGAVINNTADSFQFVYKEMSGDGSIIARVTSSEPSPQGYSIAGVMMRAALTANSPHASAIIGPGTGNVGAIFASRQVASGETYSTSIGLIPTNTYWVKVVRAGNLFSGFASPDGITWTATGQQTISMPHTIYIGLAGCSNANQWFMQSVTYDNVMTSP